MTGMASFKTEDEGGNVGRFRRAITTGWADTFYFL